MIMEFVFMILLGVMIGSFLNVCIYRIPAGESIIFPRSHCMSCGHTLGALELIPVLSYLGLRGQCKQCHHHISPRYMCIELITGMSFGYIYSLYGMSFQTLMGCTFFVFAIVLTMIDWDYMLLPTRIIYCGIGIGIIEYVVQGLLSKEWIGLWQAMLGAVIGYGLFALLYYGSQWIFKKEGLGYGDVRLMGLIGWFVGVQQIGLVILVAALLASVYGIVLLKVRKSSAPYPFGPFLNMGACIAMLWGTPIMTWYLGLF